MSEKLPCRPLPAANRAAPAWVSPERMTSRPSSVSVSKRRLECPDPTGGRRTGGRCACTAEGNSHSCSASSNGAFQCLRLERGQPIGESQPLRFFAGHTTAGEDQIHGVALAQQPGQADGAAVHQGYAPAPAVHAKHRVICCDTQIAPHRQFETTGNRVTFHRGDDGLAQYHT